MGEFSGVAPQLQDYRGSDDVHYREQYGLRDFRTLLSNVPALHAPPPCFLDTRIVVLGIGERADNPGHVYYRLGSLLRVIEAAYGPNARDQRDNVTVLLPIFQPDCLEFTENSRSSTPCASVTNAAGILMDLAGTSHIALGNSRLPWAELNEVVLGFPPDVTSLRRRVCFRRAVLWQDGWKKLMDDGRGSSPVPGRDTSFRLHGARTLRDAETVALLNLRVRHCLALPPRRRRARSTSPHVVFAARSVRRAFFYQPYLVAVLGQYVRDALNGTIEVVENSELDFATLVQVYSRADVLIGHYGAALAWQQFMPPGAVTVEFNGIGAWCWTAGIDTCTDSEYGGGALAGLGTLLVMPDMGQLTVRKIWQAGWRGDTDADQMASPDLMLFAMRKATCVLRNAGRVEHFRRQLVAYAQRSQANVTDIVPPSFFDCRYTRNEVLRLARSALTDASGDLLRRQLRLFVYDAQSDGALYSRRLDSLAQLPPDAMARLSAAWRPFRERPTGNVKARILIEEPCRLRLSTFTEAAFFRTAFARVASIDVNQYSVGMQRCHDSAAVAWNMSSLSRFLIASSSRQRARLLVAFSDMKLCCSDPCAGDFHVEWRDVLLPPVLERRVVPSPAPNRTYITLRRELWAGALEFDQRTMSVRGASLEPGQTRRALANLEATLQWYRRVCGVRDINARARALGVVNASRFIGIRVVILVVRATNLNAATWQLLQLRELNFCEEGTLVVVVTGWLRSARNQFPVGPSRGHDKGGLHLLFTTKTARFDASAAALRYVFGLPTDGIREKLSECRHLMSSPPVNPSDPSSSGFVLVLDAHEVCSQRQSVRPSLSRALREFVRAPTGPFSVRNASMASFALLGGTRGMAPLIFPLRVVHRSGPMNCAPRTAEHPDIWAATQGWVERTAAAGLKLHGHSVPGITDD